MSVQRPATLDEAFSAALLHEEFSGSSKPPAKKHDSFVKHVNKYV